MKKRIITGSIILIALAVAILSRFLTTYIFDVMFGVVACIACVEVAKVNEKRKIIVSPAMAGTFPIILYVGLLIGMLNSRPAIYFIIYIVFAFILFFLLIYLSALLFKADTTAEMDKYAITDSLKKFALKKGLYAIYILFYPALLMLPMFFINHMPEFSAYNAQLGVNGALILSTFFMLAIFIGTIFTDTFALVCGMLFKGPKLCPKISPKKTISGAIGGLIFGTISVLALYLIFMTNTLMKSSFTTANGTQFFIVVIALLIPILTQVGDIIASLIKRKCYVKDYGTILPGHGGIMDRIDGLILSIFVIGILIFLFVVPSAIVS